MAGCGAIDFRWREGKSGLADDATQAEFDAFKILLERAKALLASLGDSVPVLIGKVCRLEFGSGVKKRGVGREKASAKRDCRIHIAECVGHVL